MADEEYWMGWLVDDLANRKDEAFDHLTEAINKRNIPRYGNRSKTESVEVKANTTDMWWRDDTPQISVTSEMDGRVKAAVVIQDYGTSLWVAVRMERSSLNLNLNWAKSMAWSAFQVTLERVVIEALTEIAGDNKITDIVNPNQTNPGGTS